MSKFTDWYPASVHPVRSGFYQFDSADLLHFDTHTRTWGIWYPQQPGVRHVVAVGPHLRWRGLAQQPKTWQTYEEVATEILGRLKQELGLAAVEGKQSAAGNSGTDWELDAKGIKDDTGAFVVIECKRYTTSRLNQSTVGSLAWCIQEIGAAGGFIVSPFGLQAGASKVAASANIQSVTLNADATPQQFAVSFLRNLFIGFPGVEARFEAGQLTAHVEEDV